MRCEVSGADATAHPHPPRIARPRLSADPCAGLVDVAVTRAPFDDTGISTRVIRSEPVGVVLRTDDPLAERDLLRLADLVGRTWFQFPDGTDPLWRAYWNGTKPTPTPWSINSLSSRNARQGDDGAHLTSAAWRLVACHAGSDERAVPGHRGGQHRQVISGLPYQRRVNSEWQRRRRA